MKEPEKVDVANADKGEKEEEVAHLEQLNEQILSRKKTISEIQKS